MGDEGAVSGTPVLEVKAAGNYPIESYEIYDWDERIYSSDCLSRDSRRVRIRWSGVVYRGRGKSCRWDGMVYIQGGKIASAEKYAFDRIDQGIVIKSDKYVKFTSSTSGDYDGLILDLEATDSTVVKFSSKAGYAEAAYGEIMSRGFEKDMGGLNLKLEMAPAYEEVAQDEYPDRSRLDIRKELPSSPGEHAFWVKVLQSNGNAAWSSPIFVKIG